MSTLQGIPTQHGISILKSNLKQTAKKFQLIGASTHNAPSASLSVFHTDTIEASYYDDNGVLTFVFNLPIETHFNEYLYQIKIVDTAGQSIVDCQTPVIALAKGIGGMVTLKAAVSGQAGQVIFKHNQYVTETELLGLHFSKLKKELLALRCGEIELFDDPNPRAGWVDLDGAPLSRTTDALLWAHAQRTGLLITQALKETNHKKWAAYWGTGDGSTTFTRPNAHLVGAYLRATPAGVAHGEYQGDAIRNFTGKIDSNWNVFNEAPSGTSGVFKHGNADYEYEIQRTVNTPLTITGSVLIDASLQVPTAAENRPHSINYAAKIHRGWM